jgi:hypothetical protein
MAIKMMNDWPPLKACGGVNAQPIKIVTLPIGRNAKARKR